MSGSSAEKEGRWLRRDVEVKRGVKTNTLGDFPWHEQGHASSFEALKDAFRCGGMEMYHPCQLGKQGYGQPKETL
jgi:hypothetical protein